jgi:hypothetical protein
VEREKFTHSSLRGSIFIHWNGISPIWALFLWRAGELLPFVDRRYSLSCKRMSFSEKASNLWSSYQQNNRSSPQVQSWGIWQNASKDYISLERAKKALQLKEIVRIGSESYAIQRRNTVMCSKTFPDLPEFKCFCRKHGSPSCTYGLFEGYFTSSLQDVERKGKFGFVSVHSL